MNIVSAGNDYQIYGEDVKTFKSLPVTSYNVNFKKMRGFFLTSRNDLTVTEPKIYGDSEYRVDKVLRSYKMADRNFGVLLSGQKGIGKSLFVRLLAQHAVQIGLPVLIVNEAVHGIADFLGSIDQDCVVVFDEFEKTFAKYEDWNPQDDMLTLFDGVDGGHKLFVVTCNDLSKISPYMINRPGRFHYHFTLGAPTQDEVREYMTDIVNPKYADAIDDIVNLSGTIDMPYDYLRAIAFELNQGYSLRETMGDLNITKTDQLNFDLKAYTCDGTVYEAWNERLDISDRGESRYIRFKSTAGGKEFGCYIYPAMAKMVNGEYVITDQIEMPVWDEDDFPELPEDRRKAAADAANANKIKYIVLTKCREMANLRFLV